MFRYKGIPILKKSLFIAMLLNTFLFMAVRGDAQQISPDHADLVLEGDIHGAQNNTYVEVPFEVPAGTERVTVTFSYTERNQRTTLDLGMLDPVQLRCWSGGNKSTLTVGLSDATPSCLPGPVPQGTWKVLIGVPNIRTNVTSHYTAHVYFSCTGKVTDEPMILRAPLRSGPAWYRGDLHTHTGHSDGQCTSQSGKMVPCPVFFTADAAARRGLDFLAITDHNATSHYDAMRELQPYFDKLLLIPGREVTTFTGHLNFLGTTSYVDFRLSPENVSNVNLLLKNMQKTGALVSLNHPFNASGEACMGCGWTPSPPADMNLVDMIEVVNGGSGKAGIPFWEKQLNQGYRLTAVGGSDNHRPMMSSEHRGAIGSPTTVVYAEELSASAILSGVRAGHVFIDPTGTKDRMLEFTAVSGSVTAAMGDMLAAASGVQVGFDASASGVETGKIVIFQDGKPVELTAPAEETSSRKTAHYAWNSDGKRHWFRADVYGADGALQLLGNPVYVNWVQKSH